MKLSQIMVFAKVVELGSFSKAAEHLNLSVSAVSKSISQLEDRLGARLLNRTTRHLSPTEVGDLYYESCTKILDEAELADSRILELQGKAAGTLRLNVPVTFGLIKIVPLLATFMKKYPDIVLDLTMEDRFVNLVDEYYDLAIRIGQLNDSCLVARKLSQVTSLLVASPDYLEQYGAPESPEDLKQHCCLVYSASKKAELWQFSGAGSNHQVYVKGRFFANNNIAIREAAINGLGIAHLAEFSLQESIAEGKLQVLLEDYPSKRCFDINAVYPAREYVMPKVRIFIDFLLENL